MGGGGGGDRKGEGDERKPMRVCSKGDVIAHLTDRELARC